MHSLARQPGASAAESVQPQGPPGIVALGGQRHRTHCVLAGLEPPWKKCSWNFGEKVKTLQKKKKKIFARWRCLKSGNILTPAEWAPNEPKPNKYSPYRAGQRWSDVLQKNLQQQAGFLRRAVPPSACLSSRRDQHWATESCSRFSSVADVFLGAGAQIHNAWRSSPLLPDRLPSVCPQFTSTRAFLAPRVPALPLHAFAAWWSLCCGCFTSSLCPSVPVFRSLKDYVCIQNIDWWLIVQQKWSRVWEEEALWLRVSHKFKIRIVSALGRTVSREVEHGRFHTWEEVSRVLASCVKFHLDLGFCCLPWWVVLTIHERRICVCVRWFCPRSSALMRYFLSFSVCSFPITLMI